MKVFGVIAADSTASGSQPILSVRDVALAARAAYDAGALGAQQDRPGLGLFDGLSDLIALQDAHDAWSRERATGHEPDVYEGLFLAVITRIIERAP